MAYDEAENRRHFEEMRLSKVYARRAAEADQLGELVEDELVHAGL